jgi:hypothetical protein
MLLVDDGYLFASAGFPVPPLAIKLLTLSCPMLASAEFAVNLPLS